MPEPYVPKHPQGVAGENLAEPPPVDTLRAVGILFRGMAMSVTLLLLLFGAYYAIDVFRQVGALVANPATGKSAVDALAELIDAPRLTVVMNGEKVPVGRAVAVIVLGLGYLLWARVPLAIMSISGRLLLTLASDKKGASSAPPP